MRGLEIAIYTIQTELITKRYGEERANKANYGWGVGGSETSLSVATKTYPNILTTDANLGDCVNDFVHVWDVEEDEEE